MAERPHVLYVDDDKEITDLMTMALGAEGFDVTVALDGQAAIDALSEKSKIDAIVLDYMMPNLDGLQFLERVSQNPELHTVKSFCVRLRCPISRSDGTDWKDRCAPLSRAACRSLATAQCSPRPFMQR